MGSLKMAAWRKEFPVASMLREIDFPENLSFKHISLLFFSFLFWRSFILRRQMFVLPSRISKLLLRISFGSSFAILHLLFSFFGFKILGSSFYSFQQLTLLYTHREFFFLLLIYTPHPLSASFLSFLFMSSDKCIIFLNQS